MVSKTRRRTKAMFEQIKNVLYGKDINLRERIFRMIILVAGIVTVIGIVECIILRRMQVMFIPLGTILVFVAISYILTSKFNRTDIAAVVLGFVLVVIVFPEMFLLNGGLEGGAPVWFVLGLLYIFLMFSGLKLKLFLAMSFVADAAAYTIGYIYYDYLANVSNRAAGFIDSMFSVIAVGTAVGVIVRFQMKLYNSEREVVIQQNEELEKLNNSQNAFFANMSHEIRTPINTIIGLNEMILRENKDPDTREYARNIGIAGKMLLSLVNDILDLSRMELKRLEIIPVEYNTAEMFLDLRDIINVRMKEKNLQFIVDLDESLPRVMFGDERRIKQVILNLLTNAVKYTNEGSITLTVRGEQERDNNITLRISVKDTGIGIRKEDMQYLYDVFKRIDEKKNRKIEGSGLGLSISRQLLELMGGDISVDSIYTKGSTFTATVSQRIVDHSPIGNVLTNDSNEGRNEEYRQLFEAPEARILVVDDNTVNAMVVGKLLGATKVQIDVAHSGEECLEKTMNRYYHVILMDYMMPGMDGAETLKSLRSQENGMCRESAVIVLSANNLSEAKELCKNYDFDGYLEKPIQGETLEKEILKFLPDDIIEYRKEKADNTSGKDAAPAFRQRRKKVCVTTDCVCDFPDELLKKYDIGVMYLYIRTEQGRFADTREIDSDNLPNYINENGCTAKADSVSVEEYEQFFAETLTHADEVIHVSMAENSGKSYKIAVAAANGFDHVHVIDSGQISGGEGLVAIYAAKLAQEGRSCVEICEAVNSMKSHVASKYFAVGADLFYKNGYTTAVMAKLCKTLNLHPLLGMKQSRIMIMGLEGGDINKSIRRYIRKHLRHKKKINTDVVVITHVGCSVKQQQFIKAEVKKCVQFDMVVVQKASLSNACNVGLGTVGIAYYKN
jgi:DegV family protein with EDD domain